MDKDGKRLVTISTRVNDDAVDAMRYCYNDIITTMNYSTFFTNDLSIKKVIFHDPATIVYWTNGTRTVVKCSEDDTFDPEKGLAMAICKRVLGENFKNVFKEHLPKEEISERIKVAERLKKWYEDLQRLEEKENNSDIISKAHKAIANIGVSAIEASKNLSKYSKKD